MNNIIITGTGGQGTVLAAKIIGETAVLNGLDVKASESHGMSQRGGSVTTYVRYSKDAVHSPVINERADIILAFELLEGYRAAPLLKAGGRLISGTQMIDPTPVTAGEADYPDDIVNKVKAMGVDAIFADTLSLAAQAGSIKCSNVVLIGILAAVTNDMPKDSWIEAIKRSVPPKLLETNLRAFESGYALAGGVTVGT